MRDFCMVACPTYGGIPPRVVASWFAQEGMDDCAWAVVEGAYLPNAMNGLTEKALQIGARRMIVLEQDMVLPHGGLRRMIDTQESVVGALYFRQPPPHWPLVFMQEDGQEGLPPGALKTYRSPTLGEVMEMIKTPGMYRAHAVGMGCTSISMGVFRSISKTGPWWAMGDADPYRHTGAGHDVRFCQAALEAGHNVWVDSSVICGHLKWVPVGPIHFEQMAVVEAARAGQFLHGGSSKEWEVMLGRPVPEKSRRSIDIAAPVRKR